MCLLEGHPEASITYGFSCLKKIIIIIRDRRLALRERFGLLFIVTLKTVFHNHLYTNNVNNKITVFLIMFLFIFIAPPLLSHL